MLDYQHMDKTKQIGGKARWRTMTDKERKAHLEAMNKGRKEWYRKAKEAMEKLSTDSA